MTTPTAGLASIVPIGSQPVLVANPGIVGGIIRNPLAASDQGLANAEVLYVDPVGPCTTLAEGGTIVALQPGDSWEMIPGQTTPTIVNAASSGHKFTSIVW